MMQSYIRIVRPLCYDSAGVLPPPSLAPDAPLLVSPRTGRRLNKLSRHLMTFFYHTTGLRLTATRLRQIFFTQVEEKGNSRSTSVYAAADTHSGKWVAKAPMLFFSSFTTSLLLAPPPTQGPLPGGFT